MNQNPIALSERLWLRQTILTLLIFVCSASFAHAVLVLKVSETVIDDSEEDFNRRIYSYAIDTDSVGNLHLLYAKPVPGEDRCDIIYATGPSPTNLVKTVLATNGALASISAGILVNKTNDVVHVCYHSESPAHLVHQTIEAGVPSEQHTVDSGGWHSKMQLDSNGNALFVRESVNSLRLFIPNDASPTWFGINFSPSGSHAYRIADFVYDRTRGRLHVTYGDNASTFKGSPMHNLHYAFSDNSTDWEHSVVDSSTTLWELEFWTSLVLDLNGDPIVSTYPYAEYNGTYNTGTALLLARRSGTNWTSRRIVGYIPGQTPADHRAGMGGQLHVDEAGILLGAWDNSPDRPIDFDGQYGNIAMSFSVEGSDFQATNQFQVEPFSAEGYCRLASHRTNLYMLALGNFSDAKLYLVQLDIRRQWWWQAKDMGNSWRWTSWFGFFTTFGDPWVFHDAAHGWMYAPSFSPNSLWFWTADLGWLWTRSTTYPYFWSKERNSWLWYNGSAHPRWFVDMTTGEWLRRD